MKSLRIIGMGFGILAAVAVVLWLLLLPLGRPVPESQSLENPEAYLPRPGTGYRYTTHYPDGQEADLEALAVRIPWGPLLTQLEVPQESQPYGVHFVRRPEGIYTVWEQDPANDFLYLPARLAAGERWEDRDGPGRILKTGETLETAAGTFQNCILVERHFESMALVRHSWYAPGVGLVQTLDADTGAVAERLTARRTLGPAARLRVLLATPKAGRFKAAE